MNDIQIFSKSRTRNYIVRVFIIKKNHCVSNINTERKINELIINLKQNNEA